MTGPELEAFVVPDRVGAPDGPWEELDERGVVIRYPVPGPQWLASLGEVLRGARRLLAGREAAGIASALSEAAARFRGPSDPYRARALELLPASAGLSRDMAEAVLDGMAADWTEPRLGRLVEAELGGFSVLDGFRTVPGRKVMAVGPSLSVQIAAGSVPGVGVSAVLRSLLVKGPTLLKPGRGDVVLPVLFARALKEVDTELSDALAVVYWPGGGSALESAIAAAADVVTAYGSDETIRSLRSLTPATSRFVAYHHRVSVGLVGRDALSDGRIAEVANAVARSVAFFDQRGCVSPQVVYVEEGGTLSPRAFVGELARALGALEARLPGGRLDAPEASALHQVRGTAELMGPASGMVVEHGGDASWTVLLEPAGGPVIPCVGRVVRLRPVPNLEELPPCLDPLSPHLQTVGVAGLGEERAENLARALGILGASRVTPFAAVPFPPPWWHHDGGGPLTDLVRWVDLESG